MDLGFAGGPPRIGNRRSQIARCSSDLVYPTVGSRSFGDMPFSISLMVYAGIAHQLFSVHVGGDDIPRQKTGCFSPRHGLPGSDAGSVVLAGPGPPGRTKSPWGSTRSLMSATYPAQKQWRCAGIADKQSCSIHDTCLCKWLILCSTGEYLQGWLHELSRQRENLKCSSKAIPSRRRRGATAYHHDELTSLLM